MNYGIVAMLTIICLSANCSNAVESCPESAVCAEAMPGLSLLQVDGGALSPSFSPETYDYTIKVGALDGPLEIFAQARAGQTVSMDGGTSTEAVNVAIGSTVPAVHSLLVTTESGDSAVYTVTVTAQRHSLTSGHTGDNFGWSIDAHDDYLIVGAPGDGSQGLQSGVAHIYRFESEVWQHEATLRASDAAPIDQFGYSVAIFDGRAIVGAPQKKGTNQTYAGAAYIFEKDGSAWKQVAKLQEDPARGSQFQDRFGYSVAIREDFAVVGCLRCEQSDDEPNENYGMAYLFERSDQEWSQTTSFAPTNKGDTPAYAADVALTDRTLVVSAPYDSSSQPSAGAVYVYEFDGAAWGAGARVQAKAPRKSDNFGSSIDIIGDQLVVGAKQGGSQLIDGTYDGAAYIFHRSMSGWVQEHRLRASKPNSPNDFGAAVALSMSGDRVLVGAPGESVDGTGNAGLVYIYTLSADQWSETRVLLPARQREFAFFGADVAFTARQAIISEAEIGPAINRVATY